MQSGSTLNRHQVDRRVLASSIDFKVEFKLVAFVQLAHARTLNRADVHECVRLAIVTRDKAEALHRVEELDRARSALTRQLALGCRRLGSHFDNVTNDLKIGRRNFAATIDEVEFQLLAFCQTFKSGTFNRADVNKHIFAAVFALDEAEALLAVKELYDALAGADNLGWHSAAAAAASATAWAAEAAAAATWAAAEATAAAAAEAAAITTTEAAAISAAAKAATITAAEAATIATAEAAATKAATTAAAVRIKTTFVAESIALVFAATAPPSVKTHRNQ